MRYANHLARAPGQQMPIPGREAEMSRNAAGGYGFTYDSWTRFERFLILGSEGGTFYLDEKTLTLENAAAARECLNQDGLRFLNLVADVHGNGRAPKLGPAIFALALASTFGDEVTKQGVKRLAPKLLRTGAQLLQFVDACNTLGKWRRNLRSTVQGWFDAREPDQLAYQVVKYGQRDGMSMRDVLRLAHPLTKDPLRKALYDRICGRPAAVPEGLELPKLLQAEQMMRAAVNEKGIEGCLSWAGSLPREALPSEVNKLPDYWRHAIHTMPATALVRNLAQMTRLGLFDDDLHLGITITKLADAAWLRKARVHPVALLLARLAYGKGGAGGRSKNSTYTPNRVVLGALEKAYELSFTQEHRLPGRGFVAIDCSGSMQQGAVNGSPVMTPNEAAAAIGLSIGRVTEDATILPYGGECPPARRASFSLFGGRATQRDVPVPDWKTASYQQAFDYFGSFSDITDCAAPIRWAERNRKAFDWLVIISDQETWSGQTHVAQAMAQYRRTVPGAAGCKLIVFGLVGTGTTLVDPKDPLALGIAGFDLSAMQVLSGFLRGGLGAAVASEGEEE